MFSETVQQTLRILGVTPDMGAKPQIVIEAAEEFLMTAQSCFVLMPGRVLQLSSVDEALAWLKAVGVRSCSVTAAVCSLVMLSSPGPVWPPMGGVMCCLPFRRCVCLSRGGRWLAGGRMARSMGIGPAG